MIGCNETSWRHRTESIYRRYAIADSVVLKEAAVKLAVLQASEAPTEPSAATSRRFIESAVYA
jgi:hypothetical protein